jgi:hypothetical protein
MHPCADVLRERTRVRLFSPPNASLSRGWPYHGRPSEPERGRRLSHHYPRSAPACGVSDGPRA